jgi:hypothetical protein
VRIFLCAATARVPHPGHSLAEEESCQTYEAFAPELATSIAPRRRLPVGDIAPSRDRSRRNQSSFRQQAESD